jgi:LemA protein
MILFFEFFSSLCLCVSVVKSLRLLEKEKGMKSSRFLVIVALAALLVSSSACGYNTLVSQEEAVSEAMSEIDNQLQRRNDLIPNLVETVKGYAAHEQTVLTEIAEARARLGGARSVEDKAAASNDLSGALSRLLMVAERYPDLKANQNFIRLQDELAGTENRIAVARRRYNEAVKAFNTSIRAFPTLIVARAAGFEKKPYFEAPENAKSVPAVNFSRPAEPAPSAPPPPPGNTPPAP